MTATGPLSVALGVLSAVRSNEFVLASVNDCFIYPDAAIDRSRFWSIQITDWGLVPHPSRRPYPPIPIAFSTPWMSADYIRVVEPRREGRSYSVHSMVIGVIGIEPIVPDEATPTA